MTSPPSALRRRIIARPIGSIEALTVIGPDAGQSGPWSFVTSSGATDSTVGPPAIYLALAGWAACTIVTCIGVATRGGIPLSDVEVDLNIQPAGGVLGFGVRKTVRFHGALSSTEQARVVRAAEYCPVGQAMTKGAFLIRDEVTLTEGASVPSGAAPLGFTEPSRSFDSPGMVEARYLPDTQALDGAGVLLHEGEVKLYLRCQNGHREGRMMIVSGHSARWLGACTHSAGTGSVSSIHGEHAHALRHDFRLQRGDLPRAWPSSWRPGRVAGKCRRWHRRSAPHGPDAHRRPFLTGPTG